MKRFLSVLVAVIFILTMFVGCGGKNAGDTASSTTQVKSEESTEKKVEKKDVTITGFFPQTWVTDVELELTRQFEQETGIKVDLQSAPDDQFFSILPTKINAGEVSDFFAMHGGSNALKSKINPEVNCLDLSNEPWVKRYDAFIKENLVTLPDNGKVYGLFYYSTPKASTWNLLYNPEIFTELGIEVPRTFNELKSVCEILKKAGYIPIFDGAADGWHLMQPFMHNGVFATKDPELYGKLNKNEVKFADNALMEQACMQFKELADLGYYGPNYLANSFTQGEAALVEKKAVMLQCDAGCMATYIKNNPDKGLENWKFCVLPVLDSQIITCPINGATIFVYKNTKFKDETLMLLDFLAKPENMKSRMEKKGLPDTGFTDVEANYSPALKDLFDKNPAAPVGSVQTSVKYVEVQYFDAQKDFVSFMVGKMTAKQFLEGIDKRREKQAMAEKDPNWK